MNTWYQVCDMIMGSKTKKDLRTVGDGLMVVAGSEMPAEVVAEAGRLMVELDRLKAELDAFAGKVSVNSEGVMWPVL